MNFTWRARMLLLIAAAVAALGLLLRQEPLALAGLTVVVWIGLEWVNFRRRALAAESAIVPARAINGQSRSARVLVIDRSVEIQVEARVAKQLAGLRCEMEDVVPPGFAVEGSPVMLADAPGATILRWRYGLRPTITRRSRLPGLRVTLSDPQGLFRLQRFLPLRHELTVLPFQVRPQATVSVLKQQNVQMLPGIHRHRKAGFSTELLGIREHRPGDPPRAIAWRATARLDRLMTCEYESEAPARATILADLSPEHFHGRPGPARADRIISASASLARLLLADGDPVAGLVIVRGEQSWMPHGLGERHLTRWLLRLLSFTEPLSLDSWEIDAVTRLAWTCGFRRFPELFDEAVNRPHPGWLSMGRKRRLEQQRQQLALALAELYGGPAGLSARLRFDNRLYRDYCRRLLEDHPGMVEPPTWRNSAVFPGGDERATVEALGRGLLSGAARARDNELFAIVGAAPGAPENLDRLVAAVRVARAAHHRVLMIDVAADTTPPPVQDPLARRALAETHQQSAQERFAELERRLTRLGSKVAQLDDPRLFDHVAAEVELLRSGRARATRGGR